MTVSDAAPVQFWPEICDTYNEMEVCSVHHGCWQQPFNCDDEIVIQAYDQTEPDVYFLTIYDDLGEVLDEVEMTGLADNYYSAEFIPESLSICDELIQLRITRASEFVYDDDFESDLDGWTNNGAGILWTYDSAFGGSLRATFGTGLTTRTLRKTGVSLTAQIHRIYCYFYLGQIADSVTVTLRALDAGSSIIASSNILSGINNVGYYFGYLELSAAIAVNTVRFDLFAGDTSGGNQPILYLQRVSVVDMSNNERETVLKSDSLDIKEFHQCTKLIRYTNQKNFAGIKYSQISPDEDYYIRVPMRFFHERFPETDEAMELTGTVVTTSSQLKEQKLAEIAHAPYYFHRKIQLILKHQIVEIDSTTWRKEEPYEINDGRKNWPLKSATCYLTRENSVVRNVI
jgi:hypothetical protein